MGHQEAKAEAARADGDGEASGATVVGVSAGALVIFLLLRILAVSHWDWEVASRVLDAFDFGDSVGIIAGTAFSSPVLAAAVLAAVTPFVLLRVTWHRHRHRISMSAMALAVLCAAMLLSVAVSDGLWWAPTVCAVLTAALYYAGQVDQGKAFRRAVHWLVARSWVIAVIGALILAVAVEAPWSSLETITLRNGTSVDAYVLQETPSALHVLRPGGDVEVLLNADVTGRAYR